MIDEPGQAEVDHRRFQIRHAVLDRPTPIENPRVELGVNGRIAGIRIDSKSYREIFLWDRVTDLARDRDWSDPGQRVRKIAEPFAEIQVRRVVMERLRANAFGAGAAPLDAETHRHHELMLRTLEEAVFGRRIEVLKSLGAGCRRIGRNGEGISFAKRHREILGNAVCELRSYIPLP